MVNLKSKLSHLIRLWHFLSSVNSFFKRASSVARCLIFGLPLRLFPYVMCVNSEGSGEIEWNRRLIWAFAGRLCDKYHNLMSWLNWSIPNQKSSSRKGKQGRVRQASASMHSKEPSLFFYTIHETRGKTTEHQHLRLWEYIYTFHELYE